MGFNLLKINSFYYKSCNLNVVSDMSAERKGWDGTVKGGNIQEKDITQSGIKRTSAESVNAFATDNPLYESNGTTQQNPLYNAQKGVPSNCGSVTRKTSYPVGTVEELNFACPADAVDYDEMKNAKGLQEHDKDMPASNTNTSKTKHDTVKNSMSNVR